MRTPLTLLLLFITAALFGQGWQRYYNGQRAFGLSLLPDGSCALLGSTATDAWWLHADINGTVLAEQTYGQNDQVESGQVLLPNGAGWWLWGNDAQGQVVGWRTGPDGTLLQSATGIGLATLYDGTNGTTTALLCGSAPAGTATRVWTAGVHPDGSLLWSRTDSIGISATAEAVLPLPGDSAWVGGTLVRSATNPDIDFFLQKIAPNGALAAQYIFEWPGAQRVTALAQNTSDIVWVTGVTSNSDDDIWLAKIGPNGDSLWSKTIPLAGFQIPHAVAILPNGYVALAGETRTSFNGSRDAFLALLDANGQLLLFKTYGGLKGDIFWDLAPLPDGGFALAGQTASFGDGTLRAWLVRTDAQGNIWQRSVFGQITHDTEENCQADAGEMPLAHWLVAAAGTPGIYYTTTDANGHYHLDVDTGAWYVSVLPLANVWQPCADSVEVQITPATDSLALDFSVQSGYQCPVMEVNISTPFLRRCFDNTYAVRYNNYGTAAAVNARIAVVPDPYLTVNGSSLPYTQSNDTLYFDLGDVPPLASGQLSFSALLNCDNTVLGQMHCTSARIGPDSLCGTINPGWDGAHLEVEGYCVGDSVVLTLTNTGAGGMQNPVEYVITEDQIIFKKAPVLLAAGEQITEVVYPNGATVTLIVPQTPGHPGNSTPMLVIEGCGAVPFSTGYAYQFPTNDGDPAVDVDCRANIGSYDPNDKSALPYGVGEQQIIRAGTAIEYLVRFQNTGTDTAFRVEIRDTLSAFLDISTFKPGAASHPYRWEIIGAGVLRFLFDPIVLPDSAANGVASQGFVQFRVETRKDLPDGTQITNRAGIYFDFNAPILTNTTRHTIGDPLAALLPSGVKDAPQPPLARVTASPNPCFEYTRLQWPAVPDPNGYTVRITDVFGRLLREETTTESFLNLLTNTLPEQMLLVHVFAQQRCLASGILIKTKK